MKPIRIDFAKPEEFRYQEIGNYGDYGSDENGTWFRILETGNPIYNLAILVHELYEKVVKDRDGVPDPVVDDWDLMHPEDDDPGMLDGCPYREQHMDATLLERMVLSLAGEKWKDYEEALASFYKE